MKIMKNDILNKECILKMNLRVADHILESIFRSKQNTNFCISKTGIDIKNVMYTNCAQNHFKFK